MTKQLDTGAYLSVLCSLIAEGETVRCTVSGGSMLPFLAHGRDAVILQMPQTPPGRGDIVLYRRADGAYILHRICRVCTDGSYEIIGDAQTTAERGILPEQIAAVTVCVYRGGRKYEKDSFLWRFFAVVWCHPAVIAHRRRLLALYSFFRRGRRGEPEAMGEGDSSR